MIENKVKTFWVQIHIAGDVNLIRQVCHKWCTVRSRCVTVTPTSYVYNGGIQEGATIRFLHYPKYPTTLEDLRTDAKELADTVKAACCQYSYTIEDSETTYWKDTHPQTSGAPDDA